MPSFTACSERGLCPVHRRRHRHGVSPVLASGRAASTRAFAGADDAARIPARLGQPTQTLLQNSLLSGLRVDRPMWEQFNRMLIIKRDQATDTAWWNIAFLRKFTNFTTLIISTILWLVRMRGFLSDVVGLHHPENHSQSWLSLLLIGFMAIPALRQIKPDTF